MMKSTILTIVFLFVFAMILLSCEGNRSNDISESSVKSEYTEGESVLKAGAPMDEESPQVIKQNRTTDAKESNITETQTKTTKNVQRIIKKADIKIKVEDYKNSYTTLKAVTQKHNAYISNENEVNNNYSIYNNIEIRCEAQSFDAIVEEIVALAIYVDGKNITAEDVTEQFVDIEARLKTKKEVEERYKVLLQRANSIPEIIEVEKEIRMLREEIESLEGRMKYLSDKVSYSTVKVYLYEELEFTASPEKGFGYKFVKAVKTGWEGLQMFILGIFYLWPLWLILGGALWLILRLVRGKKKKKNIV